MKSLSYALAVVGLTLVLTTSLADAGGWAVVTLDQVPGGVMANQPFGVSFAVRQHGRTLLDGLSPKITLNYSEPGSSTVIYAKPVSDKSGWYQAAITLPKSGAWTWSIDAFGAFPQPMPTLRVGAPAPVDAPEPVVDHSTITPVSVPSVVGWLVALLGFAGGGVAFVTWMRSSAPAPFAVSLLAFAVGFGGGAYAALPTHEAAPKSMGTSMSAQAPSAAEEAALDGVQRGHDLFLAKGCIVCHAHATVSAERRAAGLSDFVVGPTLTNTQRDPAFLHSWLKDPAAVKPGTEMPTLGLGEDEISALVKFLSVKSVP